MKRIALSLLSMALFAMVVRAALQTGNRGAFTTLAPAPSVRQEISTAALGAKIYVIAGFNSSGGNTNTVDVYDPQSNAWSSAAPLPIGTNHNAAAVAAGKLYAFGGTSNRTFLYNPQTNSWSDVAPMRFQHANSPAVGVIKDKIYVAGGSGPNMNQTELEVYDPALNTWTQLASMSIGRNHTAGGVIDSKFYVVGGRPGDVAGSALEVYDPATNAWTRLANMPTGRSGVGAGVVNNELYVFGGELPRLFDNVEVYNPLNNTWTQLAPMQTPKHGIFASVIDNKIYLPSGATQQGLGATDINEVFTVNTAVTASAASFSGQLAPKAIAAAFGAGLATTTLAAPSLPLPTELGGATVRITDSAGVTRIAPLFYASPEQINYQIPADTASGPAVVHITSADNRVSTGAIQITAAAPALFTFSQTGQGPAAALDGFTFTLPPFNATGPNGQPNVIALFGTGLGADATDVDGNVASNVQATIEGNPVVVQYAGRAPGFTGLNQLNLVLPVGISSGVHNAQVSRGGVASNVVTIAIK